LILEYYKLPSIITDFQASVLFFSDAGENVSDTFLLTVLFSSLSQATARG